MKNNPDQLFKSFCRGARRGQETTDSQEAPASSQSPDDSIKRYEHLSQATKSFIFTVIVKAGRTICTIHYPGVLQVTGYTEKDYAADPHLWFDMIHADDKDLVLRQIETLLRGDTPPPLKHRILHKDGTLRWVQNTSIPVFDAQGNLVAYDGLIIDITNLEHATEEKDRQINVLSSALVMVKSLHSLLPICSSCKKIRDDKGYWQQLETYFAGHYSAIAFTHGICPDCAKALYPQYHEAMNKEVCEPVTHLMLPFTGQDYSA